MIPLVIGLFVRVFVCLIVRTDLIHDCQTECDECALQMTSEISYCGVDHEDEDDNDDDVDDDNDTVRL